MSRKTLRFLFFLLAGFATIACKKNNPLSEDHLNASRIKIILERGVQESLHMSPAKDGGVFVIYSDTAGIRHALRTNPEFGKVWGMPLPAMSWETIAQLEMEDHSLYIVGGNKWKRNQLSWYHLTSAGLLLDTGQIKIPVSTNVPEGNGFATHLIRKPDGKLLLVGGLKTEGGILFDHATLIPFTSTLDLNFQVQAFNMFHVPIPQVSYAAYSVSGLTPLDDGRFLLVGSVKAKAMVSEVGYQGFFSCLLNSDGMYLSSKGFQTGTSDTIGKMEGFSPTSWALFPDGVGRFKTLLTPATDGLGYNESQPCRIATFDQNGNYVDSTHFNTYGFRLFRDVEQKPDGGFIVVGSGAYTNFGMGINFKKESSLLNISPSGAEVQWNQPAYTSSNSLAACCRLSDGRIALLGDVLNPQDRQINLILIKLDESGRY